MAVDSVITHRKRIRERFDLTALHRSNDSNLVGFPDQVKLDVVAHKVTIFIPTGLEADIRGSVDGNAFFDIALGVIGPSHVSYGEVSTDNLVKIIAIDHIGQAADGTIVLDNSLVGSDLIDGERFILNDGVHPAVTFEFDEDDTPGVIAGYVAVPFETGNTATGSLSADNANPTNGISDEDYFTLSDGTTSLVFEFDNDSSITGDVAIPFDAGAPATGTLTAQPQAPLTGLVDGDTFTLDPGSGGFIFEFDTDSVVSGGHIPVPIALNATAAQVKTAMISAIQGASIGITATSGAGDDVDLTNDTYGTAGNVAITENINNTTLSPTGMAGGLDFTTLTAMKSAIITAINGSGLALFASNGPGILITITDNVGIGSAGNVAITENMLHTTLSPTGMSGGMDIEGYLDITAAIAAAINGASNLDITATDNLDGTITLINDTVGSMGNQAITDTVATGKFSHTGMANGDGNSGSVTIAAV